MPPFGSTLSRASGPSAASTKQYAQQRLDVLRGVPHALKHVSLRFSTVDKNESAWQSRRMRLTTLLSFQWQPAVGLTPLHSPDGGIEYQMPLSLSAAAPAAHAATLDTPEPKPQNLPTPLAPRKADVFSQPTCAVHALHCGGNWPFSQSQMYSPSVHVCDLLSGELPLTQMLLRCVVGSPRFVDRDGHLGDADVVASRLLVVADHARRAVCTGACKEISAADLPEMSKKRSLCVCVRTAVRRDLLSRRILCVGELRWIIA